VSRPIGEIAEELRHRYEITGESNRVVGPGEPEPEQLALFR